MARFEPLSTRFTVADAENPAMVLGADGALTVTFKDWREQVVSVAFADVAGLRWQEGDRLVFEDEQYDGCGVVAESPWLAELLRSGDRETSEGHKHYKFNFNACGCLEVLATGLTLVE